MTHTTFDEFMAEQTAKSDEPGIDRDNELKEWEKQLDRFYQMVESFLYSYIKEGKVQCHYGKKQLHERLLGSYQAKSLVLKIGVKIESEKGDSPSEEHVDPVMQLDWKIATPRPNIKCIELQEESFKDAIMEVMNG